MSNVSDKRVKEVLELVEKTSIEEAAKTLKVTETTIKRYLRRAGVKTKKTHAVYMPELDKDLLRLKELYSPEEVKALIKGGRVGSGTEVVPTVHLDGEHIRIGAIGDTHIGSRYTSDYHLKLVQKVFKDEGIDIGMHSGDVTEGMSHRAGHIYELSHIGYERQKAAAVDWFNGFHAGVSWYGIDGNHDRWYMKGQNIGADIVKDIERQVDCFTKVGSDVGYVNINGMVVELWHGEDGNSYAKSYRPQKVVESITIGKKPNLLLLGHCHKALTMTERGIQVISVGSIQQQTNFMRGKRIGADTGMYILDIVIHKGRIGRLKTEWIPFYA